MQSAVRWIRPLLLLAFAAVCGAVLVMAGSYLYLAPQLPDAIGIREVEYQTPLRIYSSDEKLMAEYGEKRREPVTFDHLPPLFVQAVLAAEDERFFRHAGVDVKGLARAAVELIRYREIRSGGSTITMQVARNFFLDREQRFLRKFNEIVLAMQIEHILTKEQILELYLNKIYLGHRSYGAQAAAKVYYGKDIGELTLPQWAMIAGLPKAPSAYNPITNPERAVQRRNWILGRMHETGAITEEQMEQARRAPVTARYHTSRPEVEGAYVAEMARLAVADIIPGDLYTQGLRVITTVDSKRQEAAVRALREGLHEYDERHGYRGPLAEVDTGALPKLAWPQGDDAEAAPEDEAPQPELARPEEEDQESLSNEVVAWLDTFKDQPAYGPLRTAIVTEIREDAAAVLLGDGKQAVVAWKDISWARPALRKGYVGEKPKQVADVLKVGNVIYLRPVDDKSGAHWRLAQLPQAQSALVSLDPETGALQALQGGYSFAASNFNRAMQGQRQAGSVFKPFVYTAALENGFTPATIINDAPVVYDSSELGKAWRPKGSSGRFYGPTRMREALYRSLNLVSIRILRQVGIQQTMETLKEFGLPYDRFQRDLSLALGSGSLTPLELATAYAMFANGGYRVTPWYIDRIEDRDGHVLWRAPEVLRCDLPCADERARIATEEAAWEQREQLPTLLEREEVSLGDSNRDEQPPETLQPPPVLAPRTLDPEVAWLMNSMLQDVIKRGTGRQASSLGRKDLAGKTGTTNNHVDAWFSGYAPSLVTTVWVGLDTPTSLGWGEYGGRAALPIWISYMGKALEGVPETALRQPPGIVSVRIDPKSGLVARSGNSNAIFEYFREDEVPEQESPYNGGSGGSPEQIF